MQFDYPDSEIMSEDVEPIEELEASNNSKTKYLIGGGAAIAALVGAYALADNSETTWSDTLAEPDKVETPVVEETPEIAPEPEPELSARGVIQAKEQSTIASRMTAKITAMPYRQGRSFPRGALLARFDCSATQAQLNAARASARAYKVTYDNNLELDAYEAVGKNEVEVSRANVNKAQAEVSAIQAQMSDCAVYAPYSGTVVEQIASRGEIAASGAPLMKIQSGSDLQAELIVPSNWLVWLEPGAAFTFAIDETGNEIKGTVTRLGASVDPVSKTIRINANIDRGVGLVLPGMSGTATFSEPVEPVPEPEVNATGSDSDTAAQTEQADGDKSN